MDFFAAQNFKKISVIFTGSALLTLIIFYLMQALIAVGDVELNEKGIRIADVTMPDRDLELLMDIERPEEEEPPPETMPPEFDMTPPADLDNATPRPKFDFKGRKSGVFADGSYVPIFKVPPLYPRRAQERGIEGCVMLEFAVTKVGAVRDPVVLWSIPSGIFDRAAMRSALKFKYKPQIRDGVAIEVTGVLNQITFIIEDKDKSPDYSPEGCA
ncbi:MAG TPA: energy transducer TonB [Gammaproteobacteria bacterium]|jgi:protein TonB|nr:energy transducer TonB [Gammaproteobacteria bacterium]HIA42986.1 energy transducer TonB [Gammaproteobacteria bacterium]HIA96215.1 energy transducer TonB [Gammaproteobacteria bacterium]HIG50207.1 energy transducer TonB [Gammaproteobacteria bacterium]HIM21723.1 energy transducer TonB [Gammaproteobacteria bacterium]